MVQLDRSFFSLRVKKKKMDERETEISHHRGQQKQRVKLLKNQAREGAAWLWIHEESDCK
jgi:hypothetical protein